MGWIIYISGFILTYLMCKWIRSQGYQNTWGDVLATMFVSIFSWVAIIIIVFGVGIIFCVEKIKIKNPPKWL